MSSISSHTCCHCLSNTNHLNTSNPDWMSSYNELFHVTESFNRSCSEENPHLFLTLLENGSVVIENSKKYSRAIIQNLMGTAIRNMIQRSESVCYVPILSLHTFKGNYQVQPEKAESWRILYELGPETKPFLYDEVSNAADDTRDPSNSD